MADDRAIRAALKERTGWSAQNLSNRVTAMTKRQLMSRTHALYVLAHRENVHLEKFRVDDSTLIEVGRLAVEPSAALQEPTSPRRTSKPSPATTGPRQTAASRFAARDLHPNIVHASRKAFTSSLHQESVRKAFQSVNNRVKKLARTSSDGSPLMGWAFNDSPKLQMTNLTTESEQNEHKGLRFLMQGAMLGIRNPRAHEDHWEPDKDETAVLELISFASYLHRCLDRCESYAAGSTV